jgi:3-dehydrosphinganine reductase
MNYYRGKRVLVTGGSEGIGLSVAQGLLKHGANVTVVGRSQAKLDKARSLLPALNELRTLDLVDCSAVKAAVEEMAPFELVINCVGFARPGYLLDQNLDDFHAMMDANFFAAVNLTKALLPSWTQRRSGHLVHTSSLAGFLGVFGYTGYCASKFALMGFCEALKRELRPSKIAVSVLCPPNTRTPGLTEENRTKPAEVLAAEEKAKVVEPDFVAEHLLKCLPRRPFLVIPTFDGQMAHKLNRWVPSAFDLILKRPD